MSNKQKMKKLRKQFRENCLQRDNNKCVKCGASNDLAVHHITDRHDMPNDGYAISNGITLCPECHIKAEQFHISQGAKWEENYAPKDLYKDIGSSPEEAIEDCENLDD